MRNEPDADSAGAHYFSERPAGAGDRRLRDGAARGPRRRGRHRPWRVQRGPPGPGDPGAAAGGAAATGVR